MNSNEKQAFADAADVTIAHPIMQEVIEELLGNLGIHRDALSVYGVSKVASYAAQVARAQALGIDPEELRSTPEEAYDQQWDMIADMLAADVDTIVYIAEES